jgi:hypothetical protein
MGERALRPAGRLPPTSSCSARLGQVDPRRNSPGIAAADTTAQPQRTQRTHNGRAVNTLHT